LPLSDFMPMPAGFKPEETGRTPGENAAIKAKAYATVISKNQDLRGECFIVIADDTSVSIDGLGGEPGIHVRRWVGHDMDDEEILSYTLERMEGLTGPKRNAHFRTALCMIRVDERGSMGVPVMVDGSLDGRIMETADPMRIKGFPFEPIFFVPEFNMLLGTLHLMPPEQKPGKLNHRERAVDRAVPVIQGMMQ
jgi:XTP/dITP diphosphohydrolase